MACALSKVYEGYCGNFYLTCRHTAMSENSSLIDSLSHMHMTHKECNYDFQCMLSTCMYLQRREGGRGAAGVVPAERGPVLLEGRQRQPHVLAARDTPHHPAQPPRIRESMDRRKIDRKSRNKGLIRMECFRERPARKSTSTTTGPRSRQRIPRSTRRRSSPTRTTTITRKRI